ncbi:energy transducer TonB [Botryobacter ruber]|uniref:energy transducer TonB n=1 Tax=Botryobacter ruber TaxID=2171629 RepID=UPI000E0B5242|nr:energy transducer TonB [Botryobacter ruber]
MKSLRRALLILCVLVSVQVMAQERQYYNTYWEKVAKGKAIYYGTEELIQAGTPVVKVTRYFLETDTKQSEVNYAADAYKAGKEIKSGEYKIWNKDGKLVMRQNFVNNKRNDSLITYYESGRVKRIELYENGKMLEGTVFAEDGAKLPYFPYEVMPQFPGGEKALFVFLAQNIKYPKAAIMDKASGSVLVSFIVEKDGKVKDIKVKKSVHPAIDAEAVRVIAEMPTWVPGEQDGEPISVRNTLPVKFTIK